MDEPTRYLGTPYGLGCVKCPIDPPIERPWAGFERAIGTPAIVVFKGESLCYKHFMQEKDNG